MSVTDGISVVSLLDLDNGYRDGIGIRMAEEEKKREKIEVRIETSQAKRRGDWLLLAQRN